MDYHSHKLVFKIRKVLRYMFLYGILRTLAKVRGHIHMNRTYSVLPPQRSFLCNQSYPRIGIIGCGNYAYSNIAYYISKHSRLRIVGVMDSDIQKACSLFMDYNVQYYTTDADRIATDPNIDIVFISSNHASHAEYASKCISLGKHVHIEKPHVVTHLQLENLISAMLLNPSSKVFLGFNRPRSHLFKQLKQRLDEQSGPLMINWFIAGHEIPDGHWYFDELEGGRVLGNLCHWTDLTLHMVGLDKAFPCKVQCTAPPESLSDFVFSALFADRSCATISFSAKGHTFEGVREVLNVHKGDLIANITDFQFLSVDIIDRKFKRSIPFRDHGHRANINYSLTSAMGETPEYVRLTAMFFLAFKEALDTRREVLVDPSHNP